ncbi:MAG: nickel pincer cofactor biosynthesis protein LarC [Thermoguttaceae bacterium]|nr:nickel pincer cofactor biosynthesis protein LarC [Thermoguttaceae bacterium]MDW8037630.1 nickel pincer cofactor biosynthesis protein LarC [Thermoguttaceae bacterium]
MGKIAYLDCSSGISGDMMLAALVDAGASLEVLNEAVESLGLGARLVAGEVKKKGIRALKITVEHPPQSGHRHLEHIQRIIEQSRLTDRQKKTALTVFVRIAQAEAKVHGTTVEKVHFHELGAVDSIVDICGVAVGLDLLGIDRLAASPIPVGSGWVQTEHGRLPVPAPATGELLCGIPLADSFVQAELTTPTGAAIVACLVEEFGPLPAIRIERIGYGAGSRDLQEQPNILRLFLGEPIHQLGTDTVWILETNLDDTSGEWIGYCTGQLLEAGALDVYTTAIQMKKNRPAVKLSVLCRAEDVGRLEQILFQETTTLGIRRWPVSRHLLPRSCHRVQTAWGPIEGKVYWGPDGQARFSPEFDACQRVAVQQRLPLRTVYDAALRAFDPTQFSSPNP